VGPAVKAFLFDADPRFLWFGIGPLTPVERWGREPRMNNPQMTQMTADREPGKR